MQRAIVKPVGTPVRDIDTPALLIDLERLDANLGAVQGRARAEAWVHKTPAIARSQTAPANVVGIAVRSIAEAEVFASAGFDDIRVLRPLVTPAAQRRAAALGKSIRLHLADDGVPLAGADALDDAVTVSSHVTSAPEPGRAILDCGQKAIGRDFGDPTVVGYEGFRASAGSAEHGGIAYPADATPLGIGDWLQLRPADVATVFTLHDVACGVRDGVLEAVWPISARGAF
ncbi:MAG: hypothetical protein OXH15_02230 [Gammaproteobacteria bacterium]|nr:hypothetical protein [Gammaproteobacteria bacterium]